MAGKVKASSEAEAEAGAIVVKKYANRRLYNTATSSYVTLDDLSAMVKDGVDFVVYDAKSGDDITRSVLTQIIFEQESRGQNLLPITFLRRLIRFYDDSMQAFVPSYLEFSLENFSRQRDEMQERFAGAWPGAAAGAAAMGAFEETARQNMALFEQAMRMFAPFAVGGPGAPGAAASPETPAAAAAAGVVGAAPAKGGSDAELAEMRKQIDALQKRLDTMSTKQTADNS